MTTISLSQKLLLKFKRRLLYYLNLAIKKPDYIIMFCFSRIHFIRYLIKLIFKEKTNLKYEGNSVFADIEVNHIVDTLKKEGIYLGLNLPEYLWKEIIDCSKHITYLGNANLQFSFHLAEKQKEEKKHGTDFITGYNFDISSICPAVKKLENDPKLWSIATKYFEKKPTNVISKIWWTFPQKKEVEERARGFFCFHYDLEDYWCLKFMFYLTNVDVDSGPHVCVKSSHKRKKLSHQFSLLRETDDNDIISYYGSENILTICERAGVGFVEDPFCFHKGTIPTQRDRLILEVKFTLHNYETIP
ncbi:hypothetical protein [Fischerella thermalis]|uniref:Phytanoyl-CoA dioxygenase n=1 Tax=Fischerella thermalis CCMEE 5318 TaxID=2019666 RepID=A0A2N6LM33_9CYAN|nr:hypothetical protein [Fischerella thermalis]PMB26262.1 hypothetical protein CEN46_04110 [Fischerella thermalis CCMEE 5318]PMB40436.1 hypothetical protein CEN47_03470 [Fischerella thermalis CCMEE 5319]